MPYCLTDFDNFLKEISVKREHVILKKRVFHCDQTGLLSVYFLWVHSEPRDREQSCYCCDSSACDQTHACKWFCVRVCARLCMPFGRQRCPFVTYSKYGLNQLKHVGCVHVDTEAAPKHPPIQTSGLIMNSCPKSDVCHQHFSSPGRDGTWQYCCNLVITEATLPGMQLFKITV